MIWLNILAIIGRVIFGLCIIGFVLGSLLWHKHTIFENIFVGTSFVILAYGFVQMFVFAILGRLG